MDADKKVRVGIEMTKTGSGATDATNELKQLNAEAGKAEHGMEGLKHGHEEAGHAAEGHEHHMHALHKIFHTLNELVPGLGILMQAAFSPIGAIIMAVVMAMRYLHEWIKKDKEEFEKLREELAKPLTGALEAVRDGVAETAVGMENLKDKLGEAARKEQGLKEQVELASASFKKQGEAAKGLSDALKENQLANLDDQHKQGLISEADYAKKKLEIEIDYINKKRQLDEAAEMTEIVLRRRLLEHAESNAPDPAAAERKKQQALVKLHSLASKQKVEEDKKTADKAMEAFEEKHEELTHSFREIGMKATPQQADVWAKQHASAETPYRSDFAEQFSKWVDLAQKQLAAQQQYNQAPRAQARLQVEADRAAKEADRAVEQAQAIQDQRRDLERREAEFQASKRGRLDLDHLTANTAALRAGVNPTADTGILGIVARGAEGLDQGKPIKELANFLQKNHELTMQNLYLIQSAHGNIDMLIPIVEKIRADMERQKQNLSTRLGPGNVQSGY